MRRVALFLLLCMGLAVAQTDAPPEMEQPFAPDSMPPVGPAEKRQKSGKLKLSFTGATAFPEARLRSGIEHQIQAIEEYGLDEPNAYDAAFFLDSFYRKNGYTEVETTFKILGPWDLRLDVVEGPQARVGTVTINGNKAFDTKTISDFLLGPTRERFPRIRKDINLPLVEADIYAGVDLVTRMYASNGYLDAVVEPPTITFNADNTVGDVTLNVKEGIQYTFGTIRFTGTPVVSPEELTPIIQEQTRGIFTEGRLQAAGRALEDFYVKRGHFSAKVTPIADPALASDGKVEATFQIESGAVYHFDGTTVSGTEGVKPSFIENRLRHLQGKRYDPKALDKAYRTLIETGLFRNLRLTPSAVEGDGIHLDAEVEEAKPKELGVGLGYASFYGGIASISYRDLNFLGMARPFSINLEVNQRGYSGEAIYTDPWLFESDYQMRLRLYALTETLKGYSKNEIGFTPTFSKYVTDHWKLSAFLTGKYVAVHDIDIRPESLVGDKDYSVFSIGFSQSLDYRNNVTIPTRGFIFTTTAEFAPDGVGEISYFRALGAFSYYIPVTAKSTLALGARMGVITPLGGTELPIDERFFNGGATTVRSFSELTLGPKDNAGYPLGGQGFSIFNAEYTFPLIGDLYGAVFTDAGNVRPNGFDFDDMRYAIGGGLRYNLPIGAIRFDYGYNPAPRQGEAQGAFHFAVGVAF